LSRLHSQPENQANHPNFRLDDASGPRKRVVSSKMVKQGSRVKSPMTPSK
jgi:hypothetical protein